MKGSAADRPNNVVVLRQSATDPDGARRAAYKVRSQLSLLQGYADILEGLSPARQSQVLRVMARKSREMVDLLTPFLEQRAIAKRQIGDYRRVRQRTRVLIDEYRALLGRLHRNLSEAEVQGRRPSGGSQAGAPPG